MSGSQITVHHLLMLLAYEKWAEICMQVSFLSLLIKEGEDGLWKKTKSCSKRVISQYLHSTKEREVHPWITNRMASLKWIRIKGRIGTSSSGLTQPLSTSWYMVAPTLKIGAWLAGCLTTLLDSVAVGAGRDIDDVERRHGRLVFPTPKTWADVWSWSVGIFPGAGRVSEMVKRYVQSCVTVESRGCHGVDNVVTDDVWQRAFWQRAVWQSAVWQRSGFSLYYILPYS